jgi:hypothetical protein
VVKYTQVKVSVRPEVAEAFKRTCGMSGVSMASEISRFMSASHSTATKPVALKIGTRPERRRAVRQIVEALESIRAAEERYRDNIPENLQAGQAYENAENAVAGLEEAISVLEGAF